RSLRDGRNIMFTGIIKGLGSIGKMTRRGEDALLEIDTSMNLEDIGIGDSVAVNGACLTVTAKSGRGFTADVSSETLARTNLKALKREDKVNLEKALRLADPLGGHIVLGHVDGIGKVREKAAKSGSTQLGVEVEEKLSRYIVEKGSITLDGVSLTVNRCEKNRFYVNIISHTAHVTTLDLKKVNDSVNIETDILGKYVEKLLHREKDISNGLDIDFLAKHGFFK
ncbi:MAG: riboflavin synthase, partial [Syntrophales bacterium]|nr:riboflavin synthase [Syntrophales bacterium]